MDTENKSLQMAIEAIKQEGRKEILIHIQETLTKLYSMQYRAYDRRRVVPVDDIEHEFSWAQEQREEVKDGLVTMMVGDTENKPACVLCGAKISLDKDGVCYRCIIAAALREARYGSRVIDRREAG